MVGKLTETHQTPNKTGGGNYQISSYNQVSAEYVENNGTIKISDDEEDQNLSEIPTNLHSLLSGLACGGNPVHCEIKSV